MHVPQSARKHPGNSISHQLHVRVTTVTCHLQFLPKESRSHIRTKTTVGNKSQFNPSNCIMCHPHSLSSAAALPPRKRKEVSDRFSMSPQKKKQPIGFDLMPPHYNARKQSSVINPNSIPATASCVPPIARHQQQHRHRGKEKRR